MNEQTKNNYEAPTVEPVETEDQPAVVVAGEPTDTVTTTVAK